MEEKLCYVCSPYRGDVARNVKYAKELTGRAVRRGTGADHAASVHNAGPGR